MHRSSFTRRTRAAFTLVELLTVIAIIGVLAAIIIPTAGAARKAAHNTLCKSNLRQWGVALQLFTNDSKQRYIPYEGGPDNDYITWNSTANGVGNAANAQAWFNVLPPYVGQKPMRDYVASGFGGSGGLTVAQRKTYFRDNKLIYACAADDRPALDVTTYINPSYMMNSKLYTSEGPVGTRDGPNTTTPAGSARLLSLHDFNNVAYPLSRIAFMADAGSDNYNGDRPRIRGHGDRDATLSADRYSGVDARHGNAANIIFMDGSVRAYSSEELNLPPTNPKGVVWNPWINSAN